MAKVKSLDMILAGGPGSRLGLLTRDRTKPAVPFGGHNRIIDGPASNFVNSGSTHIVVVVEYKPASLIRHLDHVWDAGMKRRHNLSLEIAEPNQGRKYAGTANAVYQNLDRIMEHRPDIVSIFCGDHIYIMDVAQMKQFHLDNRADLTIAATPVPIEQARGAFGVLVTDSRGNVLNFEEKPDKPTEIPGRPGYCWASMGNYLFRRPVLVRTLQADAEKIILENSPENRAIVASSRGRYTTGDFGYNVIPAAIEDGTRVMLYDFTKNRPDDIAITGYWRDVGTLDQFIEANFDLLGPNPKFVLDNPGWPIFTYDESHNKPVRGREFAQNSIVANGSVLDRCLAEGCVISYNVHIGPNSELSECILMGNNRIGKNVRIRRAVLDRGANAPDDMRVGVFKDEDHDHGLPRSPKNYVIVPRNHAF